MELWEVLLMGLWKVPSSWTSLTLLWVEATLAHLRLGSPADYLLPFLGTVLPILPRGELEEAGEGRRKFKCLLSISRRDSLLMRIQQKALK